MTQTMNYYRKHRPTDFHELVGNQALVESLTNYFKEKKTYSPSYLLTGASGCGKTTLARIIATKYLKARPESIHEINSADNRGIDTARHIAHLSSFGALGGGSQVFIIDEVHMATKEWQNAMLKPLEDVPEGVYFFLCTTEADKVIKPIKTRCMPIEVESLGERDLERLLGRVSRLEGLNFSRNILQEIAINSQGSARTALNLLEKVSEMTEEREIIEAVQLSPSEITAKEFPDLCQGIIQGNWTQAKRALNALRGEDSEKMRRSISTYLLSVALGNGNQANASASKLEFFTYPTYDSGFAGITSAIFMACNA